MGVKMGVLCTILAEFSDEVNPLVDDTFILYERKYYRDDKLYLIDEVQKLSLYNFRKRKAFIFALTPKSCQMVLIIIASVRDRSDIIYLNKQSYIEQAGISERTFERCIKELMHFKLIKHYTGKRNTYWVNPSFFYAGNRLKKYPDNIIKL